MNKNIRNYGIKTVLLAAALLMLAAPALAQPDLAFVLGTETNHQALLDASLNTTISSIMNVTVYNETNVPSDLSDYDVIFLASLDNATIASINGTITDAKNNGSDVIAFNLTEDIGNVDLTDDTHSNIGVHWVCGGEGNLRRLCMFMGATFCGLDLTIEDPIRPKVVFLLGSCPSPKLVDAVGDCEYLEGSMHLIETLPSDLNLTSYDLVFVDWIWSKTPNLERLISLIDEAKDSNITVIVTKTYYIAPAKDVGNVDPDEHPRIRQYWTNMDGKNANGLLTYIGVTFLGMDCGAIEEPISLLHEGIYHPDADQVFGNLSDYLAWYGGHGYDSDEPTVGLLFHETDYIKSGTLVEDSLIRSFEEKGVNVIAYFYPHSGSPDVDNFLMEDDKTAVDAIIHYKMFGWHQNAPIDEVVSELETLNVPVIKGQKFYGTYEEWVNGTQGLQPSAIGTTIEPSERNGIFDPIVIGVKNYTYPELGIYINKPIPRQVGWIVDRTIAQMNLRYKNNSEKRVAILYWSHPGKAEGAGANQIDVYASLPRILEAMQGDGYDLGAGPLPNTTEMVNLTRNQGGNIGIWAQDAINELVENYPVALVPKNEYEDWFGKLNDVKQEEVIDMWGLPPGEIMVYENESGKYLVLPIISFGNVILAPEPSRGHNQNMAALYHSGSTPPTHQYLAFYFWLTKDFDADAMIRFGRHGTVAWLPGKTGAGLDCENCWSAIVMQNIPIVYPFTVEGVGEGILPKRRANAVMIDHLIPPMTISGLYGNLSEIDRKINQYHSCSEESLKTEYRKSIIELCRDVHIDEDMNIDLNETLGSDETFDEFLEELHDYLTDLKMNFIPYGLHIFGEPPSGDKLVCLVQSLLSYDFQDYAAANNLSENQTLQLIEEVLLNGSTPEGAQVRILGGNGVSDEMTAYLNLSIDYAERIDECRMEMTRTLDALNGAYIPPGMGGDPITNPDVLPTGRNFYAFDPRIVPTEEAETVGVYLTDELISRYVNETGEYPRKVAFMLWATHTTQDMGVMEAQILHLMGVRPIRDKNGYVTSVELINASELVDANGRERPRIDVVVTTTALYLDLYRCRLDVLDEAVRLAAEEGDGENYVKENSDVMCQILIDEYGYNESEAKDLSLCRIFAQAPGNHHNSEQDALLASGTWVDESILASTYLGTFSHVYGLDRNGEAHLPSLYADTLNGSEIAVFRRSSNVNDLISDDDYFGYFGGLGLTIRSITGETPRMWINNLENPADPKIETLSDSLWRDVRTKYFNPKWIEAMMDHGAAGAREFTRFHEYLFGWDVSAPESVSESMWDDAYDIYVQDEYDMGMEGWFDENNPWARQAIVSRMLEAIRKGCWNPSDEVKQTLAEEYQSSVEEHGADGLPNPELDEFVRATPNELTTDQSKRSSSSGGGTYPPDFMTTPKPPAPESTTNETQAEEISAIPGGVKDIPVIEEPDEVVGQVIEKTEVKTDITFSGMELIGLVAVLLVLGLIYAGFRYKKR